VLLAVTAAGQTTFRSAVDLIAIDVQVVDRRGNSIEHVPAGAFLVSIEGRRRNVVSAQFLRHASTAPSLEGTPSSSRGDESAWDPRTFIVAVDEGSFEVGTTREVTADLRALVDRLDDVDRVGLYIYPSGVWIYPTTDRAPLRVALSRVFGSRAPLQSIYNLRPWEIVDITAQPTNPNSIVTSATGRGASAVMAIAEQLDPILRVQRRECPGDSECPKRIYAEGMELGVQLQHQAEASLSGLKDLLTGVAGMAGRKTVLLISGGLLVSDRADGRPQVGDAAKMMGQAAARSQTTIYTVYLDSTTANSSSAAKKGAASSDMSRDHAMFGNWLGDFSRAAGGEQLAVSVGGGAFAFDRVLRECASYYLLGVEPAEADRDGRPRQLRVRADVPGATVRSRQWVLVPRRSGN
jgi:VWFA-related protein